MDITTPSNRSEPRLRVKSASRLARTTDYDSEIQGKTPNLTIELPSPSSPTKTPKPSPNPVPIHELLLLSPSPAKRSKTRLADRLEMAEDFAIEPASAGSRRRCKTRVSSQIGCSSPRNARRPRRKVELEEREMGAGEEVGRARKRRNSGRTKKEKPSLVVPPSPSQNIENGDGIDLDRIGELLIDLFMWKDVSKSSLWFGLGSLCFFSSCFSKGISFSIFSAISKLGLLLLGVSFFSNSYGQRGNLERRRELKLKEDDILRIARLVLPAINLVISKTRALFSGEPSMTLKVAPLFVVGAEYGHLMTLKRLCALGFFVSFIVPKLYSCYSTQINTKVGLFKQWVLETWGACSHKKIVAASVVTAFWNLSTAKARIFAVFIILVMFRYYRQRSERTLGEGEAGGEQVQQQQALVVAERLDA